MVHSRQKTQKPTRMFCEFRSASRLCNIFLRILCSSFFLIFNHNKTPSLCRERLRVGEHRSGTNGRWPKGKAMGWGGSPELPPIGSLVSRLWKRCFQPLEATLPTIRSKTSSAGLQSIIRRTSKLHPPKGKVSSAGNGFLLAKNGEKPQNRGFSRGFIEGLKAFR